MSSRVGGPHIEERTHGHLLRSHRTQTGFGKNVSHSHRRTNRRFDPNLQAKRYWLASEHRWIRLTVSAKGIKTVDAQGIESVVARLRATDPDVRRRLGAGPRTTAPVVAD